MKRLIKLFVAAFFVAVLTLGAIGGYGWKLFNDPGPLVAEKTLILKSGTGLAAIPSCWSRRESFITDMRSSLESA